jgi:hypothetical protein
MCAASNNKLARQVNWGLFVFSDDNDRWKAGAADRNYLNGTRRQFFIPCAVCAW